jgi:hypothetical protein
MTYVYSAVSPPVMRLVGQSKVPTESLSTPVGPLEGTFSNWLLIAEVIGLGLVGCLWSCTKVQKHVDHSGEYPGGTYTPCLATSRGALSRAFVLRDGRRCTPDALLERISSKLRLSSHDQAPGSGVELSADRRRSSWGVWLPNASCGRSSLHSIIHPCAASMNGG